MRKKLSRLASSLNKFIVELLLRSKDFVRQRINRSKVQPPNKKAQVMLYIALLLALILGYWIEVWLPRVNEESAKWVLSAQAQSTAAIFGLLIAAGMFRLRMLSGQEQELRSKIHSYLLSLVWSKTEKEPILGVAQEAYERFLSWAVETKSKGKEKDKSTFTVLGRLWVITRLSYVYISSGDIALPRHLSRGEISHLSKVSKISRISAINMWENYFRRPADFVLELFDTLRIAYFTLSTSEAQYVKAKAKKEKSAIIGMKYLALNSVRQSIVTDNSKLIAEQVVRIRSGLTSFYFACAVLAIALITGLIILSGIVSPESTSQLGQYLIQWLVGVPIGLSVFGIWLTLLYVIFTTS